MAVKIKVVKSPNPGGEKGRNYYRARVIKQDDYTPEQMAEDINDSTSMSQSDVGGVLSALSKQMLKALLAGRAVVLEGIGRLKVGIDSRIITEEELNTKGFNPLDHISGMHINFIPEKKVKKQLCDKRNLKRMKK